MHFYWRNLRRTHLGAMVVVVTGLIFASTASASPITTVDQQNIAASGNLQSAVTIGQSFVPSLSGIDAIDLDFFVQDSDIFVEILDGVVGSDGLGGPVLATSNTVSISSLGAIGTFHFDFTSTVALVPSQQYVLKVVFTGNSNMLSSISVSNGYTGGQYLRTGIDLPGFSDADLVFSEGLHVPEPASLALLSLGGLGLLRRRR